MFAAVLFLSTGLIAIQASSISGVEVSFWRMWMAVILIGVLVVARWVLGVVRPSRREARAALFPGLLLGFSQPVMFTAMKLTSVLTISLMTSLIPLLVSVIAVPMLGERPGMRFRAWVALAIVGAAIVAYGGATGIESSPFGVLLGSLGLFGFAFYMVFIKIAREQLDALTLLWGVFFVAAVSVSGYVWITGFEFSPVTNADWLRLLYITVISGGIGAFLMIWSMRWLPATVPPLILRAEPPIAGLLAWWILSEQITLAHLIGGAVTMVGVVAALRSPSGRRLMADERARADIAEGL